MGCVEIIQIHNTGHSLCLLATMVRISANAPISTRRHRILAIEYADGPAYRFFDLAHGMQMYSVFFYDNWTALEA